jgi:EAL domain-containing protein (putative c-di-GMP-specific phosphodiesterase class I)
MCLERHEAAFVLKSLVAHWKKAGLMTTAEWVESPELMAFAVEIGFDAVQGWYVDRILNGELDTAA